MIREPKKFLKISILAVFILFITGYAFLRSYNLLLGVKIREVNLVDGASVNESVLELKGNAKNALLLTLNGREISIDQEGKFKESLALHLGYNIVTIHAEDKFGNNDEKVYKIIYNSL